MRIASLEYRLPPDRISNAEIVELVRHRVTGLDGAQMAALTQKIELGFQMSGSRFRYRHLGRRDVMADLIDAARRALAAAGLEPAEIELIIYVGVGRGCLEPATGALVQKRLGAMRATSFDLLDACVSWIRGLEVAQSLMKTAGYRNALVVNCEMGMFEYGVFDGLTPDNLEFYFSGLTVGEAATACVLTPEGEDFEFRCRTFPEGFGYCMIPMANASSFAAAELPGAILPGKFFALSGKLVKTGADAIETVFRDAGYDHGRAPELTLIHSVSERASRSVLKRLGLDWGRHFDIHATHGNCVSASIPLGLCLAREAGRVQAGTDTLLIGAGAGVSVGLCRMRHG
jgi:3-oxoacyl-[acyl-carrier-protein] synthase III